LTLTLTEKSSQWDTVSQVATIKSGTSEIQLSAVYKTGATGKWCGSFGSGGGAASSASPVSIGSGGGAVPAVSIDGPSIVGYSNYRCASELKLRSTNANPYTATLTSVNGKTVGDVFLGSTKVGEFVNGVLKINGTEVSLY
jgi:hypothetical protein